MIAKDLRSGVEQLGNMIAEAECIVPFTGAGISTECGIPDFRSPGGCGPVTARLHSMNSFPAPRRGRVLAPRFAMQDTFAVAKPGRGHRALASLYKAGKTPAIITQNIDNLHQVSGFKADDVVELHGNTTYARCIGCGHAYDLPWVKARFEESGDAPDCTICDEPVKTATIRSDRRCRKKRCVALPNWPSNATVPGDRIIASRLARRRFSADGQESGAKLVIINNEPTEQDDIADLVIRFDIGETSDRS